MSFVEACRETLLRALREDPKITGHALCEMATYAVDSLVIDACEEALGRAPLVTEVAPGGLPDRWALTALGGYGRGQWCLRSDVDLQLVIPDDATDPEPFMRALLDRLVQQRLKVGYGVRTVTESVMLAREDVTFATAALTSRHILGDPTITETVRGSVYHHLAGPGLAALLEALVTDRQRRAQRLGDTVFVLEPDLKHGIGGLRDANLIGWLALITGRPVDRSVMFAEDVLLKVRMALHAIATFRCDRLAFEYQDQVAGLLATALRSPSEVARHLGAEPRTPATEADPADGDLMAIELMRQVHLAMRVIARRARRQIEFARDTLHAPTRVVLEERPRFVRLGDRLARADGGPPRTAADAVDAMTAVALTDLPIDAGLEDGFETLSRHLGPEAAEDPELTRLLLHLLIDTQPGASRALHLMHRTGLLTAIIPELRAVEGRIQRDLYHVYTVDEHSLRAVDTLKALAREDLAEAHPIAASLWRTLPWRRSLAVATLLHDLGKGYGPGHHERGAELIGRIAPRLGLAADEVAVARLLVRHQADMALLCMRRDLTDARPIVTLARTVGDRDTLDALYLLTISDWSSVGPAAFASWHRALLQALYDRTRAFFERPGMFADPERVAESQRASLLRAELGDRPEAPTAASDPIDDFCSALPTRYFIGVPLERIRAHYAMWRSFRDEGAASVEIRLQEDSPQVELDVVCGDRAGLLASLAGALAMTRHGVLSAEIYSLAGGVALDVFRITDTHGLLSDERHITRLREVLLDAAGHGEAAPPRRHGALPTAADALPPVPAVVTVSDEAATEHSVFDVVATDRDALLFDIADFFRREGLSVDLAFVTTEGRLARDSFYVVDEAGSKLGPARSEAVARALEIALDGTPGAT